MKNPAEKSTGFFDLSAKKPNSSFIYAEIAYLSEILFSTAK